MEDQITIILKNSNIFKKMGADMAMCISRIRQYLNVKISNGTRKYSYQA